MRKAFAILITALTLAAGLSNLARAEGGTFKYFLAFIEGGNIIWPKEIGSVQYPSVEQLSHRLSAGEKYRVCIFASDPLALVLPGTFRDIKLYNVNTGEEIYAGRIVGTDTDNYGYVFVNNSTAYYGFCAVSPESVASSTRGPHSGYFIKSEEFQRILTPNTSSIGVKISELRKINEATESPLSCELVLEDGKSFVNAGQVQNVVNAYADSSFTYRVANGSYIPCTPEGYCLVAVYPNSVIKGMVVRSVLIPPEVLAKFDAWELGAGWVSDEVWQTYAPASYSQAKICPDGTTRTCRPERSVVVATVVARDKTYIFAGLGSSKATNGLSPWTWSTGYLLKSAVLDDYDWRYSRILKYNNSSEVRKGSLVFILHGSDGYFLEMERTDGGGIDFTFKSQTFKMYPYDCHTSPIYDQVVTAAAVWLKIQ